MNPNLSRILRAKTQQSEFSPADLSGLILWLDAADTETLWADTAGTTPATSSVARWDDKSGNGYNATQVTSDNRPITAAATINSKNILRFSGGTGGSFMDLPGPFSLPTGPNTLFFTIMYDSATALSIPIMGTTSGNNNQYTINFGESGGGLRQYKHGGGQTNLTSSPVGTAVAIHGWIRNGTSLRIQQNGVVLTTGNNAGNNTLTSFLIGGPSNRRSAASYAEFAIYNRALSDNEVNLFGNYSSSKWGNSWTNL